MKIETIVVGTFQCNCRIISSGNEALIIDPGDEAEKIMDYVTSQNLVVKGLLHTHAHLDHVLATGELKEKTQPLINVIVI